MEETQSEVIIGFVNEKTSPAAVQFADGEHELSESLIARLGGKAELEKLIDGLRHVSFQEFVEGLSAVEAGRDLNRMQAQVIASHFGPRFF